jgi:hypothetical protein
LLARSQQVCAVLSLHMGKKMPAAWVCKGQVGGGGGDSVR